MGYRERLEAAAAQPSHLRELYGPGNVLEPADGPRLTTEQVEELIDRALRASNWRSRLLGHPRARLFIHRDCLVTTYPDGRMRVSGPRRAA